jgi:hypothetical protein
MILSLYAITNYIRYCSIYFNQCYRRHFGAGPDPRICTLMDPDLCWYVGPDPGTRNLPRVPVFEQQCLDFESFLYMYTLMLKNSTFCYGLTRIRIRLWLKPGSGSALIRI